MKDKVEIEKDNLDIAYLLGIYLTDGYVKPDGKTMRVRVIDEDIAQRVTGIHNRLLNADRKTRKVNAANCTKGYCFEGIVYSKDICDWLIQETDTKSKLPDWIHKQSNEWKKEFLSGCIAGDGWVQIRERKYPTTGKINRDCDIGLCGKINSYMSEIPGFLDKMGIKYRHRIKKDERPNRKEEILQIHFDIVSFVSNGLYIGCDRKTKNLEIIKHYKIGFQSQNLNNVQRLDTQIGNDKI